jgi:hypothetical protein
LAAGSLIAAATASAAPLPTGHARGVHVSVATHTASFRFGPHLDFGVRYLVTGRPRLFYDLNDGVLSTNGQAYLYAGEV